MSTSVPPPNLPATAPAPPPRSPTGSKPTRKLVAAVVTAAVLTGGALIGFGSSATKVVDPVASAATLSSTASGYRMHLSMQISSSALVSPITAAGSGSFDTRDHAGSMSLAMNLGENSQAIQALGSNALRIDEILDGTSIYMRLPPSIATRFGAGKQWLKVNLGGASGLSPLGSNPASSDPSQMLQYLRAASDSVVAAGRERIDGISTTHYRAALDLARVPDTVPASDRAAAQQALSALTKGLQLSTLPVDVWVDRHHRVRRLALTVAGTAANGQTMDLGMTVDISHYGPQPRPTPPPASQVQDLRGLAGSA
jgi:hypothetical protein